MRLDPLVSEKIGGAAKCNHQPVIGEVADAGIDNFCRRIDPLNLRNVDMHVPGMLKDLSKREGNTGGLQPGRSDLVHERLEFMVVVPIDQVDLVVRYCSGTGRCEVLRNRRR